jgi:hypothetical protein
MKRLLVILLVLAALALAGCASGNAQNITITEPLIGADGKVVKDEAGQVQTVTKTMPPEAMFYQAQGQAAAQPLAYIKIPEGQAATLPGGTEIAFRLPTQVKQYTPESVQLLQEGKSLMPWFVQGWGYEKMSELGQAGIAGAKANTTTNTISTQGDGSGVNVTAGSGSGITNTSSNTPTTTTNTTTTTTTTGSETGTTSGTGTGQ